MKSKIEGNQNCRGWNMVHRCWGNFWVSRTVGIAWRHLIGRQGPYQWCALLWFTKNVVFRIFLRNKKCPELV